jgi:hypothetical protein
MHIYNIHHAHFSYLYSWLNSSYRAHPVYILLLIIIDRKLSQVVLLICYKFMIYIYIYIYIASLIWIYIYNIMTTPYI